MSLPKYYELYVPFLTAIKDGKVHTMKEVKSRAADFLELSEDERSERLPSGNQSVYDNRIGWARTYLKKAGLIEAPQRAHFVITAEGKRLLESSIPITDDLLAEKYPSFAEFKGKKPAGSNGTTVTQDTAETPQETLERVFKVINEQLADDLLTEIMNQPAAFFEALVVDLMSAMSYGDGFVTKVSRDGGIDGIIHEDKLGFNLIYIQAKRWEPNTTVGKPEIQKFAGAMMGPPKIEKGLFITTAKFSQGAREFAEAQHIILVDGQKLTELMIEYGLGVSTLKTYCSKRIDSDYFSDN
ncbi:restriction endonuclease [Bacilliculturomica massiliensis]|uniref:restriction endonuclease n=1 Tax=Bacilliculturomica massiliensis TaxID=1917867 RepID=UPI001032077C|nr:restriction endonuclease [Bacilliculturomica massiliensis]